MLFGVKGGGAHAAIEWVELDSPTPGDLRTDHPHHRLLHVTMAWSDRTDVVADSPG